MKNICKFKNLEDLAIFVAGLTKQDIAFEVYDSGGTYIVEITGY